MDPSRPKHALLASSARSGESLHAPGRTDPLPAVDDHIVRPESRAEIVDGQLHFAPPAEEPHARQHLDLGYVLRAHIARGYVGALDLLTRAGPSSDFAPDASVYPEERDSTTGGRKLEELAFEVVGEQAIGVPTDKARKLVLRGVRRVFCVVVKKRRVLEWSRETDGWSPLPETAAIDDPCFVRPLPVAALLDATEGDAAVIRALLAKGSPALDEARAEGLAKALLALIGARGLPLGEEARARIVACRDPATLERWVARAAVAGSVEEAIT